MDQKINAILKETGTSVIGIAICEAFSGSQPIKLPIKLSERVSFISKAIKPDVDKITKSGKPLDESDIRILEEKGTAAWKEYSISNRGCRPIAEALMSSGYYGLSDSIVPMTAITEAPSFSVDTKFDTKALKTSKKEDAKYLNDEETGSTPDDEVAPTDPDADQIAADGMATTPDQSSGDQDQETVDPNTQPTDDPNDPNAQQTNDDGLPSEDDINFDPATDSTVELNDNYRNEHLYECFLKLRKLVDSTGDIFLKLSADRVSLEQQRACNEQEHRLNDLKADMDKYITDIFEDKTYTENLYSYHYMQSDLVDICRRIRQILA